MRLRILLSGFCIVLVAGTNLFGRTWTSSSGATVDAELVKMERGYVELKSDAGKRLKIQAIHLSQEDREYLQEQNTGGQERQSTEKEMEAVFAGESSNRNSPEEQGVSENKNLHLFDDANIAKPEPLSVKDFPDLQLENPEKAVFMGVQYGPRKEDVIYAAFDRESSDTLPKKAFIYNLGKLKIMDTATFTVNGKSSHTDSDDKEYDTMEFRDISLQSSFGKLDMKAELTFVFGIPHPENVFLTAEVELGDRFETSTFTLVGDISASKTSPPGRIKTAELFRPPAIAIRSLWNSVYGAVHLGDLRLAPGKNMDSRAVLVVVNKKGEKEEKAKIKWDEDMLFHTTRNIRKWYRPEDIDDPGKYTINATMDLGPALGVVSNAIDYTVK